MKLFWQLAGVAFVLTLVPVFPAQSAPLERVPNTTLALPPTPPQFGYTVVNAFPTVSLTDPVCIASPPGETNRLFILERGGNMVVITNLASPTRTVFMSLTVLADSESGLIGLAFHPGYATNGFFYVFSSRQLTTTQGTGRHQRISRFETIPPDANSASAATELPMITQIDGAGNHNGGDLHFGPDGYLYASLGDEGSQYNGDLNAQMITRDFFSAILRIDVDKRPGNPTPNLHPAAATSTYAIPADNPYIGLTNFNGQAINPANIRTEFYSIGYRNPWRMTFDRATGLLYVADVGQDQYEEVSVVPKGGNCGWAYYEGIHNAKTLYPTRTTILTNPPPGLIFPIAEYHHTNGFGSNGLAVIGGVVYRGSRLAQLYGAYIFSDNTSGHVWMLRANGTNMVPFQRITGATQPSAFGVDPRNGDVLIAQRTINQIGRLDYNAMQTGTPLPTLLSGTGAFSDLTSLTPNAGIVPYDLNVPFWSDNAIKERWFSVPNTNLTIGFNASSNWSFPTGTVWIKHFELELTNGVPESRQRLETRFIVRNTNGSYGITYRWTTPPTNATLVAEGGLDEAFTINDGGTLRTQIWHYPSRAECLACHTPQGGLALGFNTAQLNKPFDHGMGPENQIAALSQAGYFSSAVANVHTLRSLARPDDPGVSLEYRVRSYLAANCVQCHQPGGPASAAWDARITTITAHAGIVNGALVNDGGNTNNRVIKPGSLENSMLLTRISTRGLGRMPPLDSTIVDTQALALVSAWITNDLPAYQTFADWQLAFFNSTNAPDAAAGADPDGDGAKNNLEYLTGTVPTNSLDAWRISIARSNGTAQVTFPQTANRGFEVQRSINVLNPVTWFPLNVAGNEPFFSVTNRVGQVSDVISGATNNFYRVRVFEP